MGQRQSGVVQLPLVLEKEPDNEEVIQERLRQAQSQSNEEYEEELLMIDRNERRARMAFRLHAGKQKEVDTEATLKSMLAMVGIPPANDAEFLNWKRKYFDDPKMAKIDGSEFVDFYAKLHKAIKMEVGGAYFALQEVLKAHNATSNISAGGYYIDPDTLKQEFQSSLVANITDRQVMDVIREIDTTGKDKIELRDFLTFMDARQGDGNAGAE